MSKLLLRIIGNKNTEYILLTLLLILGFAVRLYKIDNPIADWHSWRQADTAAVSRNFLQDGIDILHPRFDDISSIQSRIPNPNGYRMVEFPVYNVIATLFADSFPVLTLEVWLRLTTIFASILTAFFIYLLGKRFIGSAGALLAAAFYLIIPFNIYFTRTILPDPMGVFFGIFGVWSFAKFISGEGKRYILVSAGSFAMMFLIKPYLGFYLVPVAFLLAEKLAGKFDLKDLLNIKKFRNLFLDRKILMWEILFIAIIIAPFILWRWWESRYPEGIPLFWWAFNGNGIRFRPAYWNWVFAERLGHLILGTFGVVPFAFGILNPEKKNRFVISGIIGVLVYFVVVASANVMHDYYSILVIPFVSFALASGALYMWKQNVFNKTVARLLLLFGIGVMLINGWYQVRGNYIINHYEIIEAGQAVDRLTPKDAIVVAPYNGDTAFLYQTKRKGWPVVDTSIEKIIEQGADYYASVDLHSNDTRNFEKQFTTMVKTDKYIILDLNKPLK